VIGLAAFLPPDYNNNDNGLRALAQQYQNSNETERETINLYSQGKKKLLQPGKPHPPGPIQA
jgi:hypothetical protein